MEEAKKKRTSAKRMFTIAESSLNRSLGEEVPISTIERRFSDFKAKWDTVLEAHNTYADEVEGIMWTKKITQ